jgi:thiol:disulfide interchange protein
MRKAACVAILLLAAVSALAQWKDDGLLAPPPSRSGSIYPSDAKKELRHALAAARKQHKRVLLDFGGDWCYDCHLLEYNFASDPAIHAALEANFVVAHIDVGDFDKNLDLPTKYKTNIKKGVPALAVLDSNGKVLYGDPGGFFEHARGMTRRSILDFLEQWAPPKKKS